MESTKYVEDFEIGKEFVTNSRTFTEADVINYSCLTGDFHPLHTDAEFSKNLCFGERVAHGLLSLAVAMGMISHWEYRSNTI
jgi:acyl dehydratase